MSARDYLAAAVILLGTYAAVAMFARAMFAVVELLR